MNIAVFWILDYMYDDLFSWGCSCYSTKESQPVSIILNNPKFSDYFLTSLSQRLPKEDFIRLMDQKFTKDEFYKMMHEFKGFLLSLRPNSLDISDFCGDKNIEVGRLYSYLAYFVTFYKK